MIQLPGMDTFTLLIQGRKTHERSSEIRMKWNFVNRTNSLLKSIDLSKDEIMQGNGQGDRREQTNSFPVTFMYLLYNNVPKKIWNVNYFYTNKDWRCFNYINLKRISNFFFSFFYSYFVFEIHSVIACNRFINNQLYICVCFFFLKVCTELTSLLKTWGPQRR